MKKQDDDAYSPIDSKYDYYINKPEELESYIEDATDVDIVSFYKYTIKKIERIKNSDSQDLRIYWLVANKLKETSAVTNYLNGEIKDKDVQDYRTRENIEITQILKALEKKRKKSPLQRIKKFLKG